MKKKFMDFEFVIIILAGLASIIVALSAKINGEKKEKLLNESQNSLMKRQQELIKVQNELIALSEINRDKADSIIQVQSENQQKTEQIVVIQNQLQQKTEEVVNLNKIIIDRQKESIKDYDRELNSLFPMSAQMTIVIPFENQIIPSGSVDKYFELKKIIESGTEVGDKIIVHKSVADNSIESLQINRPKGKVFGDINFGFISAKSIRLSIFENDDNDFSEESENLLLSGLLSIEQMIGANGFVNVSIVYTNNTIVPFFNYEQLIILKPSTYKPIGINDLTNKYLVIKPNINGEFDIHSISLRGNSGRTRYWLSINLKKEEKRSNGEYYYYVHKINPGEVNTRVN